MKLLLPIWVMLFVFQPAPQAVVDNDDLIPALTDDGVCNIVRPPDNSA